MGGENDEIEGVDAAIVENDLVIGSHLAHGISGDDLVFERSDDFFDILA